ncbi:hypothetical protein BDV96DRAFT_652503 [Lophiotrema nucula]|uniref:SET domain-containing protein n=1 Tax=Lophiotrema nucula TaxID=690887 RepID=A0A6A5YP99_9PLEO|nr:hypothetical protein BDV96DRAFT_652503 [Lophiotrema nucula]
MLSTSSLLLFVSLPLFGSTSLGCDAPAHYRNNLHLLQQEPLCEGPAESWVIKESPGKGLGVFATRDLDVGDIIFQEAPAILVHPPPFVQGMGYDTIEVGRRARAIFDELPREEQDVIMSLAAYYKPDESIHDPNADRLKVIFRSNAYNTGKDIGLFVKFSRINHSCRPNAGYAWNHRTGKRTLYAHRNIAAGEELSVSYIGLLSIKAGRQSRLNTYGFTCSCEACTLADAERKASDRRRRNIKEALSDLERAASEPTGDKKRSKRAPRLAKEAMKLSQHVEEEGLPDYYARAYHLAAVFTFDLPGFSEIGGRRARGWAKMANFHRTLGNPDADLDEAERKGTVPIGNWMHKLLGKKLGDRHNAFIFAQNDLPKHHRIIHPGQPITEDYWEDRVNIDVDDEELVHNVWFG